MLTPTAPTLTNLDLLTSSFPACLRDFANARRAKIAMESHGCELPGEIQEAAEDAPRHTQLFLGMSSCTGLMLQRNSRYIVYISKNQYWKFDIVSHFQHFFLRWMLAVSFPISCPRRRHEQRRRLRARQSSAAFEVNQVQDFEP